MIRSQPSLAKTPTRPLEKKYARFTKSICLEHNNWLPSKYVIMNRLSSIYISATIAFPVDMLNSIVFNLHLDNIWLNMLDLMVFNMH